MFECPTCGRQFDNKSDASHHSLAHDPMPATYNVVIRGFLTQAIADALADHFENAANKPDGVTIAVEKVWWP